MRWVVIFAALFSVPALAQSPKPYERPLIVAKPGQELTEGQKMINSAIEYHNKRVREGLVPIHRRPGQH